MGAAEEKRDALRLLAGLENGDLAPSDAAFIAENIDPVYVYAIVSYLRAVYPASNPAATSVLDRVVQLTSSGPKLVSKHAEGERDPVSRWLESDYTYADFRGRGPELVELIHDKLES